MRIKFHKDHKQTVAVWLTCNIIILSYSCVQYNSGYPVRHAEIHCTITQSYKHFIHLKTTSIRNCSSCLVSSLLHWDRSCASCIHVIEWSILLSIANEEELHNCLFAEMYGLKNVTLDLLQLKNHLSLRTGINPEDFLSTFSRSRSFSFFRWMSHCSKEVPWVLKYFSWPPEEKQICSAKFALSENNALSLHFFLSQKQEMSAWPNGKKTIPLDTKKNSFLEADTELYKFTSNPSLCTCSTKFVFFCIHLVGIHTVLITWRSWFKSSS